MNIQIINTRSLHFRMLNYLNNHKLKVNKASAIRICGGLTAHGICIASKKLLELGLISKLKTNKRDSIYSITLKGQSLMTQLIMIRQVEQ